MYTRGHAPMTGVALQMTRSKGQGIKPSVHTGRVLGGHIRQSSHQRTNGDNPPDVEVEDVTE